MTTVFIVTSVINTGASPWSYTSNRSLFTAEERYAQTLTTIETIRTYCPAAKVLLVEGSTVSTEYKMGLESVCDWVHDVSSKAETVAHCIQSSKKGLGDAWLLLCGLEYIRNKTISASVIFKMSGRYRLNEQFQMSRISSDLPTFRRVQGSGCITFCFAVPGHMIERYAQVVQGTVNMYCGSDNPSLEDYLPQQFGAVYEVDCIGAEGIIAVDHSRQVYRV
jgi:hypothetical protein